MSGTALESASHERNTPARSTGIADYVLQGLRVQPATSASETTSDGLPILDSHPLPSSFPLSNASWSTGIIDPATYRPDLPISWSKSMPEVAKCWSDIVAWRSSSVSWWNENYGNRTRSGPVTTSTSFSTSNTTITTTVYPSSVSTYSLCDGSPRVDANPVTKTMTQNVTSSYSFTTIANATGLPDWDRPPPCKPDADTCRLWYYHSNIQDVNEDELLSQCGRPTNMNESCVIRGGPIELIYWPVLPKSDLCENLPTGLPEAIAFSPNVTSKPAAPEVITTLGHTFTSGTVYLSFSTLYASWDGFWNHVGPDFSDYIVPLPSSSIFTQCGAQRSARDRNHGTPLNYADLNWPVPASAYNCQARCDPSGKPICPDCPHTAVPTTAECGTIWSDINPNLAMPTEIRDLVPQWSNCDMYNDRIPNFWYDPPLALTQRTDIAGVSTPFAAPTAEPPAPSSALDSSLPVKTGPSTVEAQPTSRPQKAAEVQSSPSVPTEKQSATTTSTEEGEYPDETHTRGLQSTAVIPEAQSTLESSHEESQTEIPTTSSSALDPLPITLSRISLFSYDPITTTATASEADSTSAPLDALSVLASALSELSTTITFPDAATSVQAPSSNAAGAEPSAASDPDSPLPSIVVAPPTSEAEPSQSDQAKPQRETQDPSSYPTRSPKSLLATTRTNPTTSNFAAYTPPTSDANQISYVNPDDNPTYSPESGSETSIPTANAESSVGNVENLPSTTTTAADESEATDGLPGVVQQSAPVEDGDRPTDVAGGDGEDDNEAEDALNGAGSSAAGKWEIIVLGFVTCAVGVWIWS